MEPNKGEVMKGNTKIHSDFVIHDQEKIGQILARIEKIISASYAKGETK